MPSEKNAPRPQMAGKLFQDIHKLVQFQEETNVVKWLIYVTDNEMAKYMENKSNGLYDFFMLPVNEKLEIDYEYVRSKSATFQKNIDDSIRATLQCICSEELPKNRHLKIYNILQGY
jgi:hypothetical protein